MAGYGRPVGRGRGGDLVGQEQGRLAWLMSGVSSLVLGGWTPGPLSGGMVVVLGALAASPYTLFKGLSAGGAGGVVWDIWAALGLGLLSRVGPHDSSHCCSSAVHSLSHWLALMAGVIAVAQLCTACLTGWPSWLESLL